MDFLTPLPPTASSLAKLLYGRILYLLTLVIRSKTLLLHVHFSKDIRNVDKTLIYLVENFFFLQLSPTKLSNLVWPSQQMHSLPKNSGFIFQVCKEASKSSLSAGHLLILSPNVVVNKRLQFTWQKNAVVWLDAVSEGVRTVKENVWIVEDGRFLRSVLFYLVPFKFPFPPSCLNFAFVVGLEELFCGLTNLSEAMNTSFLGSASQSLLLMPKWPQDSVTDCHLDSNC